MKRRFLLFALLLLLVATIALSGCSGTPSQSGPGVADSSKLAESLDGGVTDADLYTPVGTYPIVMKPIELTVFMSMNTQSDYETNDFTLFLEDLTGIDLKFESAPYDTATEKLNLLLSTGDYPEVIFSSGVDINKYGVEEGILLDVEPYLDLMPNLKVAADEVPTILSDMRASDGRMYALPAYQECYHCTYASKMWANMALLEQMNLPVPTTIDAFYAACVKYKELYPKLSPLMGISGNSGWNSDPIYFLSNSYLFNTTDYKSPYSFTIQNGTIDATANKDEYRDAMAFCAKLYREGLMNEDAYTITEQQLIAYLSTAEVGALFVPSGANFFCTSDTNPEIYKQYYPMAPLEGPEGKRYAMMFPAAASTLCKITTKCQYPEAAARMIDYFYTWEGTLNSQAGTKGDHWVDAEPGDLGIEGEPALYKRLTFYTNDPQNYCWQDRGPVFATQKLFRSGEAVTQNADLTLRENMETLLFRSTMEEYEPYAPKEGDPQPLPTINLTPDEMASIQTIGVEVSKYLEEEKVQFITGKKDIQDDAQWQAYVDGLDSIGLPKLIEVYQGGYDRLYK